MRRIASAFVAFAFVGTAAADRRSKKIYAAQGLGDFGIRNGRLLALALVSSIAVAGPASASIIYDVTVHTTPGYLGTHLQFITADYLTNDTLIPAADLTSCSAGYAAYRGQVQGSCTSVVVLPSNNELDFSGTTGSFQAVFVGTNAFETIGVYNSRFAPPNAIGVTLAVSQAPTVVPEPATWALLLGMVGIGLVTRRRKG